MGEKSTNSSRQEAASRKGEYLPAVSAFLREVDSEICACLVNGKKRFRTVDKLLSRYQRICGDWKDGKIQHTRAITEVVNEMCVAKYLLQFDEETCRFIEYEPKILGSCKTVDFLVETTGDQIVYFDVKTIHPEDKDAWERYRTMTEKGYFPQNAHLILDVDKLGGEIAHHSFATREKFLAYALQFEEKINSIRDRERLTFRMFFCGDGYRWHLDQLEDFADFYANGRHRSDDQFAQTEDHYLAEREISLAQNIDDFCCLIRRPNSTTPTKVCLGVHGP